MTSTGTTMPVLFPDAESVVRNEIEFEFESGAAGIAGA